MLYHTDREMPLKREGYTRSDFKVTQNRSMNHDRKNRGRRAGGRGKEIENDDRLRIRRN